MMTPSDIVSAIERIARNAGLDVAAIGITIFPVCDCGCAKRKVEFAVRHGMRASALEMSLHNSDTAAAIEDQLPPFMMRLATDVARLERREVAHVN